MSAQLVLGTAAFGPYAGQPALSLEACRALVARAHWHGILTVETAPAYGDAEQVLRRVLPPGMAVVTKIAPSAAVADVEAMLWSMGARLGRLPAAILLHNAEWSDFVGPAWRALLRLPPDGGTRIGASVYMPFEAVAAVQAGARIVEVPYNLLDQRFRPFLAYARDRQVAVWARSAWLRGALAPLGAPGARYAAGAGVQAARLPTGVPPIAANRAVQALGRLVGHDLGQGATVALRFALDGPTAVVIGPRTTAELDAAVAAARRGRLPWWLRLVARTCACADPAVIDPRRWPDVSAANVPGGSAA